MRIDFGNLSYYVVGSKRSIRLEKAKLRSKSSPDSSRLPRLLQFPRCIIILKLVVISVGYHVSVRALEGPFANVG